MDKCGTTDLFARISRHPDVVPNIKNKETMWWSWERYGEFSVMRGQSRSFLLLQYIDDKTLRAVRYHDIVSKFSTLDETKICICSSFSDFGINHSAGIFTNSFYDDVFQILYMNSLYST